jgi:hypothetical protein
VWRDGGHAILVICPGTLPTGHPCRNVLAWCGPDGVWEIRHHRRRYRLSGRLESVRCEDCGQTSAGDALLARVGVRVA